MPTTSERRALLFLGAVIALGGAVRLARAARREPPLAEQRASLSAQLALVDQAAAADSARRRGRARAGGGGEGGGTKGAARGSRRGASDGGAEGTPRPARRTDRSTTRVPTRVATPAPDESGLDEGAVVDLDRATAEEIERLPRIGPALARRIVEDRERNGAFGSLEGLVRVRGIGPALAERLRPRVTFSGTARPDDAVEMPRPTSPSRRQTRRRGARW